jgi:hypothetical protein
LPSPPFCIRYALSASGPTIRSLAAGMRTWNLVLRTESFSTVRRIVFLKDGPKGTRCSQG